MRHHNLCSLVLLLGTCSRPQKIFSSPQGRRCDPPDHLAHLRGGAAALATLHTFLGQIANEGYLLQLALKHQENLEDGLNALTLARASQVKGILLRGSHFSLEDLWVYLARGGLPLILHVT